MYDLNFKKWNSWLMKGKSLNLILLLREIRIEKIASSIDAEQKKYIDLMANMYSPGLN